MSEANMVTANGGGGGSGGGDGATSSNGNNGDGGAGGAPITTSSWLSRYGADTTYSGDAATKLLQVRDDLQTLQVK